MHPAARSLRRATMVITSVLGVVLLCANASAQNAGVIFSFNSGAGGYDPIAGLVANSAGNLFGTTHVGGINNAGVAFQLIHQGNGWKETVLHSFGGSGDGTFLFGGLTLGAKGNLYGITADGGSYGGGIAFELSPTSGGGWNETILYNFGSNSSDGSYSTGNLIRDKSGNLYGTSSMGGANGFGTVFELSPSGGQWNETILCSFEFSDGGYGPNGGLVFDSQGNLYGVTIAEVFELSPAADGTWTKTVIHTFNGYPDGWNTNGSLVFDKLGNLYGTTFAGGSATTCGQNGCGTVFELSPSGGSWQETILHNFDNNGADGVGPEAGVVIGPEGTLYGTTLSGGNSTTCGIAGYNCGTVFALRNTSGGWEERILVDFSQNGASGYEPQSSLTFGMNGDLFGTTIGGGTHNDGAVYAVNR